MTPKQVELELNRLAEQLEGDYPIVAKALLVITGAFMSRDIGGLHRLELLLNHFTEAEIGLFDLFNSFGGE